jgi:L-amino acid N-acyltransferase YncA
MFSPFASTIALRVDQAQQKRGIARLMFEYGINYSIAAGAKRLRYATSSNNTASLALGARFGFAQIARRNVLNAKIADLKVPDAPIGPIKFV